MHSLLQLQLLLLHAVQVQVQGSGSSCPRAVAVCDTAVRNMCVFLNKYRLFLYIPKLCAAVLSNAQFRRFVSMLELIRVMYIRGMHCPSRLVPGSYFNMFGSHCEHARP